jgi:hypothetical protein
VVVALYESDNSFVSVLFSQGNPQAMTALVPAAILGPQWWVFAVFILLLPRMFAGISNVNVRLRGSLNLAGL